MESLFLSYPCALSFSFHSLPSRCGDPFLPGSCATRETGKERKGWSKRPKGTVWIEIPNKKTCTGYQREKTAVFIKHLIWESFIGYVHVSSVCLHETVIVGKRYYLFSNFYYFNLRYYLFSLCIPYTTRFLLGIIFWFSGIINILCRRFHATLEWGRKRDVFLWSLRRFAPHFLFLIAWFL